MERNSHIKDTVSDDLGVDRDLIGSLGKSPDDGVSGPKTDISPLIEHCKTEVTHTMVIKVRSQKRPLDFPPLFLVAIISRHAYYFQRRDLPARPPTIKMYQMARKAIQEIVYHPHLYLSPWLYADDLTPAKRPVTTIKISAKMARRVEAGERPARTPRETRRRGVVKSQSMYPVHQHYIEG